MSEKGGVSGAMLENTSKFPWMIFGAQLQRPMQPASASQRAFKLISRLN